jgi:hypothetical protein
MLRASIFFVFHRSAVGRTGLQVDLDLFINTNIGRHFEPFHRQNSRQ